MWQIGSVSAMREVDFQRERLYQATMHIVRNMLAEGIINHWEYAEAEKLMQYNEKLAHDLDEQGDAAMARAQWLAAAHPIGTALSTSFGDGLFDGLDEDGALRLRLADGTYRVIHAGDVFLI